MAAKRPAPSEMPQPKLEASGGGGGGGGGGEEGEHSQPKRRRLEGADSPPKLSGAPKRERSGDHEASRSTPLPPLEGVPEASAGGEQQICPYLDTIDRKVLDFDFEKLCSVSLSNLNVYACLVCGRYYQGRGRNTHAYMHSLEAGHHVFINLETQRIYCLPDNYEVVDPSLEDIKFNAHPRIEPAELRQLDSATSFVRTVIGDAYLVGLMGLNNIKRTDWFNVVVQSLSCVRPLRNYFLDEARWAHAKGSLLVQRFAELLAKLWNPRSFKSHVSPHELLQAVALESDKKFRIGEPSDPLLFFSWFLNTLHARLARSRGAPSIVHRVFQGQLCATTVRPRLSAEALRKTGLGADAKGAGAGAKAEADGDADADEKQQQQSSMQDDEAGAASLGAGQVGTTTEVKRVPFLYLSLPLPPMPLFKNTQDRSIIPQVPLFNLLRRFEGVDEELLPDGSRRKMYITRLPQYLVLHYQRFQKNSWFVEKNLTLVNFPLRGLDMRRYLSPPELLDAAALRTWSVARLKQELVARGASAEGAVEKRELEERLLEAARRAAEEFERLPTRYDLIANICHEGTAQQGSFRVHVLHRATDTWYDVQDLNITTAESQDSMAKQVVAVSEAYIQVYELRQREEEADAPLRGGVGPR